MTGLSFTFLNPIALAGLLSLPILWLILRFMPPLPKSVQLPTVKFLQNLARQDATPDTAPWWLILLRVMILLLLILAFANPVLNPQKQMPGSGPLRLIFDNSWSSAQIWDLQMKKAEEIINAAAKMGRIIEVIPTAGGNSSGFTQASEASAILKALKPNPWPSQYTELKTESFSDGQTVWISTGLVENGFDEFAKKISAGGNTTIYIPKTKSMPGLLRGPTEDVDRSLARIEFPSGTSERFVTLQALDAKNKNLGQLNVSISGTKNGEDVTDDGNLFNNKAVSQWRISELAGAGGIFLNPRFGSNNIIGMAGASRENEEENFSDAFFYISRAVEPFAKLETGTISELIDKSAGIIVLNDVASFGTDEVSELEEWISKGGILLRFSGPRMSEAKNILVPVELKNGLRSLSGDLNWAKPLKLGDFPKASPFAGMKAPDITVERQLLATPSADLQDYVWAQLSDGTPFITARAKGRGLIILVHSTATPDWSDFVLSGFYVSFLKEINTMSALTDKSKAASEILQPLLVLNGWGEQMAPDSNVKPIERKNISSTNITPESQPGFYGNEVQRYPINLGDILLPLEMIGDLPDGMKLETFGEISSERNLKPFFLMMAFAFFLFDWLIRIFTLRGSVTAIFLLLISMTSMPSYASQDDIARSSSIHLACIATSKDEICRTGLERLSTIIRERTSAEMGSALVVDPAKDELSFYPLLYWPIEEQTSLSPAAIANLRRYLSKGGMLMIDTQQGEVDASSPIASPEMNQVRTLFGGLATASLKPADKNHVIFRSFYLLNQKPEYDLTGRLWIEEDSILPNEGLSSVILTGGDWMRLWGYASDPMDAEMSYRFGVNIVLYALTGNYKADQVHMNTILERLGE